MNENIELSDRIVAHYLGKRGYKNAEHVLRQEVAKHNARLASLSCP
jgi:uncharacterized protein YqgQ